MHGTVELILIVRRVWSMHTLAERVIGILRWESSLGISVRSIPRGEGAIKVRSRWKSWGHSACVMRSIDHSGSLGAPQHVFFVSKRFVLYFNGYKLPSKASFVSPCWCLNVDTLDLSTRRSKIPVPMGQRYPNIIFSDTINFHWSSFSLETHVFFPRSNKKLGIFSPRGTPDFGKSLIFLPNPRIIKSWETLKFNKIIVFLSFNRALKKY